MEGRVMHRPLYLALVVVSLAATGLPAYADSVGVTVGESIPFQSAARSLGGTTQLNLGADIALSNVKVLPIRPALMFDYSGGSGSGSALSGSLHDYGLGVGARLTTPLYAGAGLFVYDVNATFNSTVIGGSATSYSTNGVGTNIFLGERIIPLPGGAGISAQITYRQIPVVNGVNPSGLSFALRGSF
jgi:hypothetical protein